MNGKAFKILLVDDNEEIRTLYAEIFRKNNFEVEEAIDGLDGLDKATKDIPDIIFTGIVMPRMDGFDLMNNLKKNIATKDIPVIISSHMGREKDQRKALEMGAKDFIVKSMITPKEIVDKVKMLLVNAKTYKLKVSENEFDAEKLVLDMKFGKGMKCPICGENLILSLELTSSNSKDFKAEFFCPKCGVVKK